MSAWGWNPFYFGMRCNYPHDGGLIEDVSFHAYSSRVCWLNFFICAFKFSLLSVYFPTSWDDESEIETMYEI